MAKVEFTRDSAGIAAILTSTDFGQAAAAESIAAQVRGHRPGLDVVVDRYVTDRLAASVTIRHVRGKLYQVRDGVLTRAASGSGLEVKAR